MSHAELDGSPTGQSPAAKSPSGWCDPRETQWHASVRRRLKAALQAVSGGVQHASTSSSFDQDEGGGLGGGGLGRKFYRIHHAGAHHCEVTGETFAIISVATGGDTVGASVEESGLRQHFPRLGDLCTTQGAHLTGGSGNGGACKHPKSVAEGDSGWPLGQ
eukprot:1189100-Prorocentrum_minimum.AAC.1